MKNTKLKSIPKTTASARSRKLFASVAVLLPVLLLLVAEGVLRLTGQGGYAPVLRNAGQTDEGNLIISDQAGAISYFFANPSRPGYNEQYQFIDPKPDDVFRIFILGESAAKGYPQPRHLASSAFLQAMLRDAWPDRTVEVINLGTTAVASFPVLGMMTEALEFEPDLIIVHTGHNEFFGAYGVNSISSAGTKVWMLKTTRFIRSLAIVQAVSEALRSEDAIKNKTLMEIMVGQSYTAPKAPIRAAAAANLKANIGEMLSRCRERNVPVIVCTMPSNQRDLHPVGEDRMDGLSAADQDRFSALLEEGRSLLTADPMLAAQRFEEAVQLHPEHAGVRFLRGTALYSLGQTNEARREYVLARDFDSMPWRATSSQQQAIRKAAREQEASLCDMEAVFEQASPGGCIGWELLDDHVHPTLRGQALMAESIVTSLQQMGGPGTLSDTAISRIRSWEAYAGELGENPYDRYGVDYAMLRLFNVPFVREHNREGLRRFENRAADFESALSPEMKSVVQDWKSVRPHAGGKRPITGMAARQLMREKRYEEALKLFEIAQHSVPEYTSWYMEYVYFALACREKLEGSLSNEDRQLALEAILQGKFLLRRGFSQTGLTERYTGRLYQLRGEWAEAIPFLNASRQKLGGFDLVAADQALFTSLVKTGQTNEARGLAVNGIAHSGQYSQFYQQMLGLLDQKPTPSAAPQE